MSPKTSRLFKKSLVAVAVVALSGCATTSVDGTRDGGITDTLADAGQKTMGFGATVWHRTGYLLGLHDDPGVPAAPETGTEPETGTVSAQADVEPVPEAPVVATRGVPVAKLPIHLDEVDLAMMEEDAVLPPEVFATPAATLADSAGDTVATSNDAALLASTNGDFDVVPFESDEGPRTLAEADAMLDLVPFEPTAAEPDVAAARADEPAPTEAVAVVAANDLEHRVGETETLWDIAKRTTGDATNWHVLADVNDLGPGAAVFPGQTLTIPADMVRPELAGATSTAVAVPVGAVAAAPTEAAQEPAAPVEAVAVAPRERLVVPNGASPVAPAVTEPGDDAQPFAIESGETLWDFAKRTTGDATNWQAIATQNGFDDRAAVAVREGQTIFVPRDMVRDGSAAANVAEATPAVQTAPAEPAPQLASNGEPMEAIPQVGEVRGIDETVEASAAVLAGTNGVDAPVGETIDGDADGRDIRIVEAAFTGGADAEAPAAGASGQTVLISGTYYPKAVYSDADFSAGLLMRVSPGTRLNVSSVEGQWFQVETERGTGWVHRRDTK